MLRQTWVAGAASLVSATILALPAWSQALTDPGGVAATAAARAAAGAPAAELQPELQPSVNGAPGAGPGSPPAATADGDGSRPLARPASTEVAPPPTASSEAAVPVDPILADVRQQLAQPARGAVDRADRAALAAYYAEPGRELLWVRADGFTARARHAMAEIRRAEDWGLNASVFDLPNLAATESRPAALAAAEIKLALAALQYARHARGGRVEPSLVSRSFDQSPTLPDPKDVLLAPAGVQAAGD